MAGEYDAALAIWQRNTVVDPEMANAWSGLGLTSLRLRRPAEAVEALERQVALEPSSPRAHSDLASALEGAGLLERAAEAYARHLSINPADGQARRSLGRVYLDIERYADALPELQRAAAALEPDAWLEADIGSAQARLGLRSEAHGTFLRALEIAQTPAMWTKVAWQLADTGLDLGVSLELVEKVVEAVEQRTAALTASALAAEHFDLAERLAWAWDARGLVHLQRKEWTEALTFFSAAWKLGLQSDMAFHMGQTLADHGRSADALSAYLSALAATHAPAPRLVERVGALVTADQLPRLRDAAGMELVRQRTIPLSGTSDSFLHGTFNAVLDRTGTVVDLVFLEGDEAIRKREAELRGLRFDIDAPGTTSLRLPARIRVGCAPDGCAANLQPLREISSRDQ